MNIAYFSPMNPEKSGISDFSEELIPYLTQYMTIDVFTNIKNQQIKNLCKIYDIEQYDDANIRQKYDIAVFHVGNNYVFHHKIVEMFRKYGGILELHDISLHHYLAEETLNQGKQEEYQQIMTYCHGEKGDKIANDFLQ